ncbi:bifunctional non-homologous end joining protein LigD [Georgenia soli]|uniref:DNA ligase (ATP) n=1 Tax=Georgenia soli TaxID=638953 RepID=A0A2A9EQ49_9MICO|nr:ATP-dependent DNA ligase [Georgenia soli]PFG40903.1 bifunctional non-homologous end joining protein LigD [Georgenia soli]
MPARDQPETVQIEGRRLRVTNLSKVLYPETGTTKAEVLGYLARIAPVMIPHCTGRPATRKRWPDGVGTADRPGEFFFVKDLESSAPSWVVRADIEHSSGPKTYPLVDDAATLAWLGQVAALEVHVPQWRFGSDGRPRNPDRIVLDLDPGPGVGLAECAEVARLARTLLQGMGLSPVPVTSGSKGIHLYAALDGSHTSDEINAVAHELARVLEADNKDLVVSDMKKSLRGGKVLVDWSQNNSSKTTIAPYSLRGRHRPTVAVPRTWDELDGDLEHLEYQEVLDRVAESGDPMADLYGGGDVPYADPGERTAVSARRATAEREIVQGGGVGAPGRSALAVGDRLARYRAMRDPALTPEPVPESVTGSGSELSFVIQEHHASRWHLDFRLAHAGVLVSWALPKGVPVDPRDNHLAVQTEDHPMEYGSFEGTIPKGEYGGGEVRIWDEGTYVLEKWHEGKEVIVALSGRPDGGLAGPDGPGEGARVALIRTGGRGGAGEENHWLIHLMESSRVARVSKHEGRRKGSADGDAGRSSSPTSSSGRRAERPENATLRTRGASSGRRGSGGAGDAGARDGEAGGRAGRAGGASGDGRGADARGGNASNGRAAARPADARGVNASNGRAAARREVAPPSPMMATLGDERDLSAGVDWALEMKWDGVRAIVVVDDGDVRLVSRNGNDVTALYPELSDIATAVTGATSAVLDGEIVALDERGRPSFSRLQQRFNLTRDREIARLAQSTPVHLMLFDLLEADGTSFLRETYDERRARLHELVDPARNRRVEIPDAFDGDVEAAMEASLRWGLEGVMAKRRDSTYTPGRRSRAWVKLKHLLTQEAVVIGWRPGQGTRDGAVGSLLLAVPDDDGELRYAGRVGSGFTERETRDWVEELRRISRRTAPADGVPKLDARDAHWVSPVRVAEVALSEWTPDGRMRHPRWRGWRPDKDPADVVVERARPEADRPQAWWSVVQVVSRPARS